MDEITAFVAEQPRLVRLAGRMLHDDAEAQDIVQQAWLRLEAGRSGLGDHDVQGNYPGCCFSHPR